MNRLPLCGPADLPKLDRQWRPSCCSREGGVNGTTSLPRPQGDRLIVRLVVGTLPRRLSGRRAPGDTGTVRGQRRLGWRRFTKCTRRFGVGTELQEAVWGRAGLCSTTDGEAWILVTITTHKGSEGPAAVLPASGPGAQQGAPSAGRTAWGSAARTARVQAPAESLLPRPRFPTREGLSSPLSGVRFSDLMNSSRELWADEGSSWCTCRSFRLWRK